MIIVDALAAEIDGFVRQICELHKFAGIARIHPLGQPHAGGSWHPELETPQTTFSQRWKESHGAKCVI